MPLTSTQTRALLAQLDILPRKNLGQNFLTDGNLVRKSLVLAEVKAGDVVVEIGPGLGTLTEALLAAGAEVFAVEIAPRLAAHLRDTLLPAHAGKFHLLEGDAVAHPRAGLPDDHPSLQIATVSPAEVRTPLRGVPGRLGEPSLPRFKVVANLPYAVSTPWLDGLLSGPLPERMVLMLQREAAARFTAAPGTAERGAISIFTEAAYARGPAHAVSRKCFYPEPGVDSVLLCLTRKPDARAFHPMAKKIIREFFTHRRKQIGALARQMGKAAEGSEVTDATEGIRAPKDAEGTDATEATKGAENRKLKTILPAWLSRFPTHGLDARARPEDLPLAAWLELDRLTQP